MIKEKPHYVDNKKFRLMIEYSNNRLKNRNRKNQKLQTILIECFLKIKFIGI